jgi:hypothetical protein
VFAAPPQIARFIGDLSRDACTTASNQSVDQGFTGPARTSTRHPNYILAAYMASGT